MKLAPKTLSLILVGLGLTMAGCPGDDSAVDDTGNDESGTTDGTTDTPTPATETGEDPTTSADSSGGTTEGPGDTEGETDGETEGDTEGEDEYAFNPAPPEDFTQVDRVGMPAINSAVISSKDMYNQSSPADDVAGTFVPEIVASLEFLHGALDDDLGMVPLVPCGVMECVAQAGPLVIPDTLKINLAGDPGFPNGRLPADPVMDVTLAVILLDLATPGQDGFTLANLPLNPPANDLAFSKNFPYFADPH
ncbi:MAG: DUF4331 family protein [Myxococcota bacterium]